MRKIVSLSIDEDLYNRLKDICDNNYRGNLSLFISMILKSCLGDYKYENK